jgi:hypothetical protein
MSIAFGSGMTSNDWHKSRRNLSSRDKRPISLRFTIVLVRSFVCLALSPAWADGQADVDAYKRGDYATALRKWGPLAEQEDANAQYNIRGCVASKKVSLQDFAPARSGVRTLLRRST